MKKRHTTIIESQAKAELFERFSLPTENTIIRTTGDLDRMGDDPIEPFNDAKTIVYQTVPADQVSITFGLHKDDYHYEKLADRYAGEYDVSKEMQFTDRENETYEITSKIANSHIALENSKEYISPYKDKTLNNDFYFERLNIEDLGNPDFNTQNLNKVRIEIPISFSSDIEKEYILPSHGKLLDPNNSLEVDTGMYYFDFVNNEWLSWPEHRYPEETFAGGITSYPTDTYTLRYTDFYSPFSRHNKEKNFSLGFVPVSEYRIVSNDIKWNFNPSDANLFVDTYLKSRYGELTTSYGFPFDIRYNPSLPTQIALKDYINQPFLVQNLELEFLMKVSSSQIDTGSLDQQEYQGVFDKVVKNSAILFNFFLLNNFSAKDIETITIEAVDDTVINLVDVFGKDQPIDLHWLDNSLFYNGSMQPNFAGDVDPYANIKVTFPDDVIVTPARAGMTILEAFVDNGSTHSYKSTDIMQFFTTHENDKQSCNKVRELIANGQIVITGTNLEETVFKRDLNIPYILTDLMKYKKYTLRFQPRALVTTDQPIGYLPCGVKDIPVMEYNMPAELWNTGTEYPLYYEALKRNPSVKSGLFDVHSGRQYFHGITGDLAESTILTGSLTDFIIDKNNIASDRLEQERLDGASMFRTDINSPYLLLPTDTITLGFNNQNLVDVDVHLKALKLTLIGSLIDNKKEYFNKLNQELLSHDVNEGVGGGAYLEGQDDIDPRQELETSYTKFETGSSTRAYQTICGNERYFDTLLPDLTDIFKHYNLQEMFNNMTNFGWLTNPTTTGNFKSLFHDLLFENLSISLPTGYPLVWMNAKKWRKDYPFSNPMGKLIDYKLDKIVPASGIVPLLSESNAVTFDYTFAYQSLLNFEWLMYLEVLPNFEFKPPRGKEYLQYIFGIGDKKSKRFMTFKNALRPLFAKTFNDVSTLNLFKPITGTAANVTAIATAPFPSTSVGYPDYHMLSFGESDVVVSSYVEKPNNTLFATGLKDWTDLDLRSATDVQQLQASLSGGTTITDIYAPNTFTNDVCFVPRNAYQKYDYAIKRFIPETTFPGTADTSTHFLAARSNGVIIDYAVIPGTEDDNATIHQAGYRSFYNNDDPDYPVEYNFKSVAACQNAIAVGGTSTKFGDPSKTFLQVWAHYDNSPYDVGITPGVPTPLNNSRLLSDYVLDKTKASELAVAMNYQIITIDGSEPVSKILFAQLYNDSLGSYPAPNATKYPVFGPKKDMLMFAVIGSRINVYALTVTSAVPLNPGDAVPAPEWTLIDTLTLPEITYPISDIAIFPSVGDQSLWTTTLWTSPLVPPPDPTNMPAANPWAATGKKIKLFAISKYNWCVFEYDTTDGSILAKDLGPSNQKVRSLSSDNGEGVSITTSQGYFNDASDWAATRNTPVNENNVTDDQTHNAFFAIGTSKGKIAVYALDDNNGLVDSFALRAALSNLHNNIVGEIKFADRKFGVSGANDQLLNLFDIQSGLNSNIANLLFPFFVREMDFGDSPNVTPVKPNEAFLFLIKRMILGLVNKGYSLEKALALSELLFGEHFLTTLDPVSKISKIYVSGYEWGWGAGLISSQFVGLDRLTDEEGENNTLAKVLVFVALLFWDMLRLGIHIGFKYQMVHNVQARGHKYGLKNVVPEYSKAIYKRNHFGQFRDLWEQRPYAKFYRQPYELHYELMSNRVYSNQLPIEIENENYGYSTMALIIRYVNQIVETEYNIRAAFGYFDSDGVPNPETHTNPELTTRANEPARHTELYAQKDLLFRYLDQIITASQDLQQYILDTGNVKYMAEGIALILIESEILTLKQTIEDDYTNETWLKLVDTDLVNLMINYMNKLRANNLNPSWLKLSFLPYLLDLQESFEFYASDNLYKQSFKNISKDYQTKTNEMTQYPVVITPYVYIPEQNLYKATTPVIHVGAINTFTTRRNNIDLHARSYTPYYDNISLNKSPKVVNYIIHGSPDTSLSTAKKLAPRKDEKSLVDFLLDYIKAG